MVREVDIGLRLLKTLTWRLVATAITFSLTYMLTGRVQTATAVAVFDAAAKSLFYYIHEIGWENVYRNRRDKTLR